jgi:hypothetical protein
LYHTGTCRLATRHLASPMDVLVMRGNATSSRIDDMVADFVQVMAQDAIMIHQYNVVVL